MTEYPPIRALIADKIKLDNPDFIVKNFPTEAPENLRTGATFVVVYRERIENAPAKAAVREELKVEVITPKSGTEVAELELEASLDAVLTSLSALNYVQWAGADRLVSANSYIGYSITLEAHTENVYKSQS